MRRLGKLHAPRVLPNRRRFKPVRKNYDEGDFEENWILAEIDLFDCGTEEKAS